MPQDTPSVAITVAENCIGNAGYISFDFDTELHGHFLDAQIYPKEGYVKRPLDSDLLERIVRRLIGRRYPILFIDVMPMRLRVHMFTSIDVNAMLHDIALAANSLGYQVNVYGSEP